jgi:hypothetical protein
MRWLSGFVLMLIIGVNAPAFSQVVMELDDNKATLVGTWVRANATAGFYGSGYRSAQGGGSSNTAQFLSPKPIGATGSWCIEARWIAGTDRATAAQYQVYDGSKLLKTFTANQTQNGGAWRSLGCVTLTAGLTSKVILSDTGVPAAKIVVADGVRWVWDEGGNPGNYCIAVNGGFGNGGTTFVGEGFVSPPKGACRPWSGIVRTAATVVGTTTGSACLSSDGKLFTASLHTTAPGFIGPPNLPSALAVDHIELCPGTCPVGVEQLDRGYFALGNPNGVPAASIPCTPALVTIPSVHD